MNAINLILKAEEAVQALDIKSTRTNCNNALLALQLLDKAVAELQAGEEVKYGID